jgi:predicted PurR-regulated permease PerM
MTLQRQIGFWLATLAVIILVIILLRDALLPFIIGIVLAYLLDPAADRLERQGCSRLIATGIILSLGILVIVLVGLLLAPLISGQLAGFVAKLPETFERLQQLLTAQAAPILDWIGGQNAIDEARKSVSGLPGQAAKWAGSVLESLWSGGQALASLVSVIVIAPVVAFYMLNDWDRMIATIDGWVPPNHRHTVRGLAREMDQAIAGFIRGQALVCLVLGLLYAVGLSLLGVNFGALIGIISGVISFIPYVGSLTGLLLSVGVATVQFWPDWTMPLAALGLFAAGQFIEGNILSPKLVGKSIGLHPVWLMFALVAFGSLFGFVGLLVAVPLATVVGVLARFALKQYLASPFYHAPAGDKQPAQGILPVVPGEAGGAAGAPPSIAVQAETPGAMAAGADAASPRRAAKTGGRRKRPVKNG